MIDLSLGVPEIDLTRLLVGLALGAGLSSVLSLQYWKFGQGLGHRRGLAMTIPLLTITVVLIIVVVKSSIALSLGLVGALSIVRFRTPVKETEDLTYLFAAIALGIALGADQFLPGIIGIVAFMLVAAGLQIVRLSRANPQNLYLNLDVTGDSAGSDNLIDQAREALEPHVRRLDLRRVDIATGRFQATFFVVCEDGSALVRAIEALRSRFPDESTITFVDQDQTNTI